MPLPYLGLRPSQDGYATSERAEAVRSQQLLGGLSRTRQDLDGASEVVSVRWTLRKARYDQLMAFYRLMTQRGGAPFEIDLVLEYATLTRHTAYFTPGSPRLLGIEGDKYMVAADLEVYPAAVDALYDAGLVATFEAFGGEDDAVDGLGELERLMSTTWLAVPSLLTIGGGVFNPAGYTRVRKDGQFYSIGSYYCYCSPWGKGTLSATRYEDAFTVKSGFPAGTLLDTYWPTDVAPASVWGYMSLGYGNYDNTGVAVGITPRKVQDITTLVATFNYEWAGSEHWDCLHECYLSDTAHPSTPFATIDPEDKRFEVGFFLYGDPATLAFHNSGTSYGTYTDTSGTSWTCFGHYGGAAGYYITLMQADGHAVLSGTLDWKACFLWLVSRGISYTIGATTYSLTNQLWFNGIAIGSEPTNGGGQTHIRFNTFTISYA